MRVFVQIFTLINLLIFYSSLVYASYLCHPLVASIAASLIFVILGHSAIKLIDGE